MVSLKSLRSLAAKRLEACNADSPLADTDYILTSMGFSKTDILLGDKAIDETAEKIFWEAIGRLEKGEPAQYITGQCEFMSLEFEVNSATLIPRADTEILVEAVIDLCKNIKNPIIFEVGSGSGCIAISLAHYINGARVSSADIMSAALEVARRNAKRSNVEVDFIERNILEGFPQFKDPPDIIVSNPPYIPSADILTLDRKVKDFEPISALDGGADGLDFYRFLIENSPLASGGYLAFEVGIGQARKVSDLMNNRFKAINIIKDLAGIERVVIGKRK